MPGLPRNRPREYRELLERGELEKHLIPAPSPAVVTFWRRFGFTALTIGLVMILLILYAAIFAYKVGASGAGPGPNAVRPY